METYIPKTLLEYGIAGVFLIVLLWAIGALWKRVQEEQQYSRQLEQELRTTLREVFPVIQTLDTIHRSYLERK